jgi:hypothetical protein
MIFLILKLMLLLYSSRSWSYLHIRCYRFIRESRLWMPRLW